MPLELSKDDTESWGEGHVLYTLTGEDIQVIISSARKTRREYSAVTAAAAAAPSKTDQAGQPSNNAP